jgi:hypothetical protein
MRRLCVVIAVLLLAVPAMAQDKTEFKLFDPVAGASFGIMQKDATLGNRVSYWFAAPRLTLNEHMTVWGAVQRTVVASKNLSGVGPKFLLVIKGDELERWRLIAGGGWLSNFLPETETETAEDAFTFDCGLIYEFLEDHVYVGGLGSMIDVGDEPDWSFDFGIIGKFYSP